MADDAPAPTKAPTPAAKKSGGGIGAIIVIVVLLAGVAAAVVFQVRRYLAKREHVRDGWNVATYLANADADAKHWQADAQLTDLRATYTDASGNAQLANMNSDLRFTYQTLSIKPPAPAQLGAAPKTKPTYCELSEYIHDRRPELSSGMRAGDCNGTPLGPVRCSVVQIWQRAIAKGAPATALAEIDMHVDGGKRTWRFEIIDQQHVDHQTGIVTPVFDQRFADDCAPDAAAATSP